MAVYVVSGDANLIGLELDVLIDRLVGDSDRATAVEDFDLSETSTGPVLDALATPPMLTPRRCVILRNVQSAPAEVLAAVVPGLTRTAESVDVVATVTGRPPKVFADAMKQAGAETIGVSVGTRESDRIGFVEVHLTEAGLLWAPDVPRVIAAWMGEDPSRIAGLAKTLAATYGDSARITRSDVEVFLDSGGRVAPWSLTDAIDQGDVPRALVMLHRFLADGSTHALQVLALLANRYAQMMRLDGRDARSAADVVAIIGGKEYPARKLLEQYQRLGSGGVARAVAHIAAADVDLRGGKDWPDELVLEVLVGRLCQLVPARGGPRRPGPR